MTREPSSTSSSSASAALVGGARRLPVAAVLAIAFVLLFEYGFVWANRYRIWDGNYTLLEKKRHALMADAPPDDIAIFGTSRFYHLQPERIKTLLPPGGRVTNYAWSWCGLEIFEAMLRGLIAADRVPKVIVVDGHPEMFGYRSDEMSITGDKFYRLRYAETAPFWPGLRTTIGRKMWRETWNLITYQITPPSVLYEDRVKDALKYMIKNRAMPPYPPNYDMLVNNWERQGYFLFVNPPDRRPAFSEFEGLERDTGPWQLRKNPWDVQSYERFLRLAEDHNVKIILLPVPLNPLAYKKFTDGGVLKAYDEFLDRLQRRYPNFTAPPPRYMTWPDMLGDAGHVNRDGAKMHMDLVMDMLGKALNSPSQ